MELANFSLHLPLKQFVSNAINFGRTAATSDAHENFPYEFESVFQSFGVVYVEAIEQTHHCCEGISNIS